MSVIQYSPQAVSKAGADFQSAGQDIQQKAQSLQQQVINMKWDSPAARSFKSRFEGEWRPFLLALMKALNETGQSLVQVSQTYSQSEQEKDSEIKSIARGMSAMPGNFNQR